MLAAPLQPALADTPMAEGQHGMVVSAQLFASDVGRAILQAGGNAIDAAVAVGYALAVVYPAAGNLGGGGFMTIRFADGRSTFLDFREKAPLRATETMFQDDKGVVVPGRSTDTWLAVGVPGSIQGMETALAEYGRLPRSQILGPAIKLAREGFELNEADAVLFETAASGLAADPRARALFTHDGKPLHAGDRLLQPQLAATLETVQRLGSASVTSGPIGAAIAEASGAGGGLITREDFARYRVRELTPIQCRYRGLDVISAPPPSSGGTTLCEILNILEGFDLKAAGFHTAREVHLLVEAMRRGYRDRNSALGDPDFVKNPIARLLDTSYAAQQRASIADERATPSVSLDPAPTQPEGQQTTHFSVVDADGNAVAVTTTLNGWFGTGKVAGDTGILMNNEMDDFTSAPGAPNMFGLIQGKANAIAPGKTPLSSMSPTILARDGKLLMVTGSPGGSRIINIVLETIVNVVDHGMTLGEAVSAPRIHHQFQPDSVDLEPNALTPEVKTRLEAQGYAFRDRPPWGHAESILVGGPTFDPAAPLSNSRFGVADPRAASGSAAGY